MGEHFSVDGAKRLAGCRAEPNWAMCTTDRCVCEKPTFNDRREWAVKTASRREVRTMEGQGSLRAALERTRAMHMRVTPRQRAKRQRFYQVKLPPRALRPPSTVITMPLM